MTGPIARIILRYCVGVWAARSGLVDDETAGIIINDPDIEMLLAAAVGACIEGFYIVAKRTGRAT